MTPLACWALPYCTDQGCVNLVRHAVERDGAILLDLAFLFEEEQVAEVTACQADLIASLRPAIRGTLAIEAPVRGLMILTLDPGPESSIEQRQLRPDQLASLLQSRVRHRSTQRIDPKCRPKVRHAALLQLSPMPASIAGNRRILNRNRT